MSDPAWQWCTRVNLKDRLTVKCNYCKQIISGGISRFKHHIAGTHNDVAQCKGSQENPLPVYVKHQCTELLNAVKASRIEKEMEDAEEGYGDPHEEEESEGEDVQLEEEDVGVSLGTAKGKGIMHGGGSSATATRKRRDASISSVSRGRGRSHGRTGGGRVPTMRSSNMSGSIKNVFPNYTVVGAQPEIHSWVEEEPSAILDEDDLDFLNVEGAAEIIEGEAWGEQWNVGDIPFPTEGIEEALNEENEDDDEE
ncbi:hypothetical protein EJ110_NYTH11681 [Nymphaea thermarum]|nr:hypothetical protein EJ110_NYTH11681 [Nymphaea thermarum]